MVGWMGGWIEGKWWGVLSVEGWGFEGKRLEGRGVERGGTRRVEMS